MRSRYFRLALIPFLMLVFVLPACAQVTTADLTGRVLDPKGLAVVGATISVISRDTGAKRDAVSGDDGGFGVPLLPVGQYRVTVSKAGFATAAYDPIELVVGQKVNLEVNLKLGSPSEIMEVTGEAPLVESSSSQIQGSLTPLEVANLPVVDRNFAGLMTLIPGVRPAENFDPTKTRSGNVTVNGSDGRAIDYNVDGGDNKDNVIGGIVQNYTMEGIQEFNVVTDRYTAESGRAVGAVVNVISKSGTNNYHGTLFGLFQNSGLNSEPFTATGPNPKFHRYQYGGSVGGPVKKDKLFFFGAFEQKREPGNLSVDPSAFAELTALATADSNLAAPVSQLPFPYIDDLVTVKMDWHISDKQSVSARYGREKWTNPNDQLGSPFVTDLSQTNTDVNQFHSLVLSHNYVISPSKINTFTVQFQDFFNGILPAPGRTFSLPTENGGTAVNPEICFKPNPGCGGGAPEVEVGQNVNVPQTTFIRKYQFRDDFNWTHGAHSMHFGANYIYLAKLGGSFFFGANGYQVTFLQDPSVILGNPATYPEGLATPGAVQELTFNTGSGSTAQPPAHSVGLYYQDDYKVNRRLTLNLGLRWDANPKFLVPQLSNDPLTTNRAIAALLQVKNAGISDPVAADGLARVNDLVGNESLLRRNTASWKEFQPRVGFAWDATGSGKVIVRGGFGIARDQVFQNLTLFAIQEGNPTLYQTVLDLTNSPGPACTPAPGGTPTTDLCQFQFGVTPLPSPNVVPSQLTAGGTGRIIDPRLDDPWSEQASIGAAWQTSNDYAISVDYYHVLGTHEPRVLQMNPKLSSLCDPAYPTANPADARCINGAKTRLLDVAFEDAGLGIGRLGELRDYSTNTRSLYDGINVALKKRFSRNFMFQASDVISWSRGWGGLPTSSYGGSGLNITPEREFLSGEFGPTNFDERNRFTASGIFNLPHGFEVAPSFQASSGRPYTALAGGDIDGDGRSTIDRACADGTNTLGCKEFPVNSFRGKAFVEFDLRAAYVFKIRENMRFRIIWEMYNIGNRNNSCNNVDTNFYNGAVKSVTFGAPQGYCGGQGPGATFGNAYRSQFGFRFEF
ncbi:MAG TPA: carboxypeptidase regulatory-like domain-containing protein [Candidatus Acidoferrum sp.]|nr:carboxypeptidase regulatory-like domain-containing protein [Candidatus Acidoferrum sp.]